MSATSDSIKAPPLSLLALELRAWAELGLSPLRLPRLRSGLPSGDGHAVMIVPGFGAGDLATQPLRSLLRDLGYAAYGWNQGINLGMRGPIKKNLNERLVKLHARHDGPVSLIGWSLGGVFVREMARYQPDMVRRVISLGSPINERPDANNMMVMFRLMNAGKPVNLDLDGFRRRITPPPVPCTAIYTRTDGIVAWQCCLEAEAPNTENVEVSGSHMGLPFNPEVARAIAERLAQSP